MEQEKPTVGPIGEVPSVVMLTKLQEWSPIQTPAPGEYSRMNISNYFATTSITSSPISKPENKGILKFSSVRCSIEDATPKDTIHQETVAQSSMPYFMQVTSPPQEVVASDAVDNVQESRNGIDEELKAFIAANLTSSRRDYHKDLLFGIFLRDPISSKRKNDDVMQNNCNITFGGYLNTVRATEGRKRRIESMATIDSQQTVMNDGKVVGTKFRRTETTSITFDDKKSKNEQCRISSSHLALLPRVLNSFPKRNDSKTTKSPIQFVPGARRRTGVTARHFLELTKYVSSRFMNSSLGRSTINTKNSSLQTVQAEHKEMIPGQKVASFQPFGLVYNECSLAALANWSTQSDVTHATPNGEHLITTSSIVVPAASSTYRKCSICDNFGHYEIECLALLKQSTITSMADQVSIQLTLRAFEEAKSYPKSERVIEKDEEDNVTALSNCEVCASAHIGELLLLCDGCGKSYHTTCLNPPLDYVPDGGWFCSSCENYNSDVSTVVEIEGCEGFVIEQQKRKCVVATGEQISFPSKQGQDLSDGDGWCSSVAIIRATPELDRDHAQGKNSSSLKTSHTESTLFPGAICWAMQRQVLYGEMGTIRWWPAIVQAVVKGSSGEKFSTCLVTLVGVHKANAVHHTSCALPFLEYFETYGYNKINNLRRRHRGSKMLKLFEEAVWSVVNELGFTTWTEVLQKSRELCRDKNLSIGSTSSKRLHFILPQWAGADEEEIDGIVLLSKERNVRPFREIDRIGTDATRGTRHSTIRAGSTVTWMADHFAESLSRKETQVGTVLAIDNGQRLAVVRPLTNWKQILPEQDFSVRSREGQGFLSVNVAPASALTWIAMDDLHVISNRPTEKDCLNVSMNVLPRHLCSSRQTISRGDTNAIEERKNESGAHIHMKVQTELLPTETLDGCKQVEDLIDTCFNESQAHFPSVRTTDINTNLENDPALPVQMQQEDAVLQNPTILSRTQNISFLPQKWPAHEITTINETLAQLLPETFAPEIKSFILLPSKRDYRGSNHISESVTDNGLADNMSKKHAKDSTGQASGKGETCRILDNVADPIFQNHLSQTNAVLEKQRVPCIEITTVTSESLADPFFKVPVTPNCTGPLPSQSRSSEGKCLFAAIPAADDLITAPAIVTTTSLLTAPVPQGNIVLTPLQKVLVREDTNMIAEIIEAHPALTDPASQRKVVAPSSQIVANEYTDVNAIESPQLEKVQASEQGTNVMTEIMVADPVYTTPASLEKLAALSSQFVASEYVDVKGIPTVAAANSALTIPERQHNAMVPSPRVQVSEDSNIIPGCFVNPILTRPASLKHVQLPPFEKVLASEDANMIAEIIMVAHPVLTTAMHQNNAVGCAPNSEPPMGLSTDDGDTETGESEYRVSSMKGSIDDEEMLDNVESEDEIHKGCDEMDETDDVKSINDSVDSMPEKFWAPKLDKKFQLEGIFEVEAIIDDRTIGNGGREYCIKWKGFTLNDCTWEPERNIFDPNFIRQYKMEKLLKEIEATREAKIPLSPSAKVAAALAVSLKRVWSIPLKRKRLAKTCKRLCPFCCQSFNDGIGVLSHMKIHSTLSNFAIIRDAARVLDIAWYKSHEQDHTNWSRKVGNG